MRRRTGGLLMISQSRVLLSRRVFVDEIAHIHSLHLSSLTRSREKHSFRAVATQTISNLVREAVYDTTIRLVCHRTNTLPARGQSISRSRTS